MAGNRNTLVLFDIGGVLLSLDFQSFYDKAASCSTSLTPEMFKERYIASRLDFIACKGLITRSESVQMIRTLIEPREGVTDEIIESLLETCWTQQVDELVELKRRLYQTGYSVGILSNITELALGQISARYPRIFETFEDRFPKLYSCRLRTMKPEPEIYRLVNGYEKVVFIDDKEMYVDVPVRLLGWKGIWFTPYIDEAESLRASHGDRNEVQKSEDIRRADSVDELKGHLRDFGIEVT